MNLTCNPAHEANKAHKPNNNQGEEINTNQYLTIMKKNLFPLAVVAGIVLTSCSGDELTGSSSITSTGGNTSHAIIFNGGSSAITRADHYGANAATKLGNKFVVYGTKHTNAEDKTATNDAVVFNNFQVAYTASTAGTAESNTSDWDYVGLQAYDGTPTSQAIKYWDFSAAQGHTFYAFSSSDISYPKDEANDKVLVSKVTTDANSLYNKGYAVTIKEGASLGNLYFSNRTPVTKENYEKTVNLTFRNVGTLLRIGFYETIPGYKVKIDRFYIDEDAAAAVTSFAEMKNAKTDGFYASLQNVKSSTEQTLNVTYNDNSDPATENVPKLTNPTGGYNYALKLGTAASIINQELSTTATSPTWVTNEYTAVLPFEGNTNPLLLKLDFTMYAEDGSPDVIHVRGARAIVPATYVKWKSNFAYTYIFKITDKTNGTTGDVDENGDPTDPEGLKPITFDAIAVDVTEERQETVSSVSTNSITTYAEGAIVNEYKAGEPIYIAVTNNADDAHPVITPTAIGTAATQAQVYQLNKAATEAEVFAQLTGSPVGLTMTTVTGAEIGTTVPLADGSTSAISNVKFTPASAGTYAYVYTRAAYVAPTYEVQTSGTYDSSKTYYLQSGSGAYFAVPVTSEASFEANKTNLYLQTAAGTAGVYDIKTIKVQ